MKQELIDIVFTSLVVFLFLSLSLSPLLISFGWTGWLLTGGSAKVLSAMVLLLAFLYMCLSALLGWKGCSIKSMKQELFDMVFTSSVVFTISSCCNLCERVCSCLLLMGWNGCRLVCLFAVAGGRAVPSGGARQKLNSGSLSSDLLIMHGWEGWLRLFSEVWALVPPRFLHFSHFSCLASVYLFVDGVEACALQPI